MIMYKMLQLDRKSKKLVSSFVGGKDQNCGLRRKVYSGEGWTKAPKRGLKAGYGLFVFHDLGFAQNESFMAFWGSQLWEVEVLLEDVLPQKWTSGYAAQIYQLLYEGKSSEDIADPISRTLYDATRTVKKLRLVNRVS